MGHAPYFIPHAGRLGQSRAGRAGNAAHLPNPCGGPPWDRAAKSPGGALAHREDMHHARRGRGQHHHPTRLHGTTGHAEFSIGVSFGFTSGGGRVLAFLWETLTEDEEILELILSWKQTPGGQRLGGDLAVALVQVGDGVGWLGRGWAGGGSG